VTWRPPATSARARRPCTTLSPVRAYPPPCSSTSPAHFSRLLCRTGARLSVDISAVLKAKKGNGDSLADLSTCGVSCRLGNLISSPLQPEIFSPRRAAALHSFTLNYFVLNRNKCSGEQRKLRPINFFLRNISIAAAIAFN